MKKGPQKPYIKFTPYKNALINQNGYLNLEVLRNVNPSTPGIKSVLTLEIERHQLPDVRIRSLYHDYTIIEHMNTYWALTGQMDFAHDQELESMQYYCTTPKENHHNIKAAIERIL